MFQKLTSSLAQNRSQFIRSVVFSLLALTLTLNAGQPVLAVGPDSSHLLTPDALYDLVLQGQGAVAVARLATLALDLGGWQPAPGDELVFDPGLARNVRGSVQTVDLPPFECLDAKLAQFASGCNNDLVSKQHLVRLGRAAFVAAGEDGRETPRHNVDDMLAVLIEEAGHSWQEYLFETEGQGDARIRQTSYENWLYWSPGWEYQVKMYILNLDGTLLQLSAEERAEFVGAICRADGYANLLGHHVPAYGAPAGWPNPAGWPTADPSPVEHATFCMNG